MTGLEMTVGPGEKIWEIRKSQGSACRAVGRCHGTSSQHRKDQETELEKGKILTVKSGQHLSVGLHVLRKHPLALCVYLAFTWLPSKVFLSLCLPFPIPLCPLRGVCSGGPQESVLDLFALFVFSLRWLVSTSITNTFVL